MSGMQRSSGFQGSTSLAVQDGHQSILSHLVLNNDLASTFAEIANVEAPDFVDGRSLEPLLDKDPPEEEHRRSAFLVETATEVGRAPVPPLSSDPVPPDWRRAPREGWGRPSLEAVKTKDRLYVECATGEREL